jgi:putative ABC transport system permease protein
MPQSILFITPGCEFMFTHYLKILFRNTIRQKGFAMINLAGLVVGITVCLQVYVFVDYEEGFDHFHKKNIYRLCETKQEQGDAAPKKIAQTAYPVAPALKAEFPGVKNFTRVIGGDKVPLQPPGKSTIMGTMFGVDASFLQVFDFRLLKGDANAVLKEPRSIVLTKGLSRSLFGDQDPIGQTVRNEWRDTTDYIVTGVLEDIPARSHLRFDALYSMSTYEGLDTTHDWNMDWLFTYLELNDDADTKALEAKLPAFLGRHNPTPKTISWSLFLQPLYDAHLRSNDITRDLLNPEKFNGNYLPPLIAIALFVLLLAIINYINLATARSFTRAKEVAVRKTSGAGWVQIAIQLLMETMVFSLTALLISIGLMLLLLPLFSQLSQRDFDFNPLRQPLFLLASLGIVVVTGIVAGIFPALSLASVQPVKALKGRLLTSSRSVLRNTLVIVQFTISIALSMITLHVFRQLKFIRQYDTGFNKEAVIVLPVSYTDRQKEETMMEQFKQGPGVLGVTGALRRLGNSNIDRNKIVTESGNGSRELICANMFVDYNFCSFYQLHFLAGRDLSPAFGTDRKRQSFIINESLARELINSPHSISDFSSLVGKRIRYSFDDDFGTIIGIVRDFNFNSLHERVEPLCMTYLDEYYFIDLSIRVDLHKANEALAYLQRVWKEFLPNQEFSYYFLDKQLQKLYSSDIQTSRYVATFTLLAFIVACLGIIGMVAFNIERRVKEIGIRKVLGAGISNIVFLLSKELLKLVLISIVIALPLSLMAINQWMQNFAYRVNPGWWLFALSGLSALCIAQCTISYQAFRAARANPVKSLKME